MTLPTRLPQADQYGNHWLGPDHKTCPVILKAGTEPHAPRNAHGWFASRGGKDGVLFDGTLIRYFDSPELAFDALRDAS